MRSMNKSCDFTRKQTMADVPQYLTVSELINDLHSSEATQLEQGKLLFITYWRDLKACVVLQKLKRQLHLQPNSIPASDQVVQEYLGLSAEFKELVSIWDKMIQVHFILCTRPFILSNRIARNHFNVIYTTSGRHFFDLFVQDIV